MPVKGKIFQERIKISKKQKIGESYFKLALCSSNISCLAKPGQFVEIKINEADVPLLRRPLGIHRVNSGRFEVLCEIVGEGTLLLSKKNTGDFLDVIGPLGNGFDLQPLSDKYPVHILVAGGMGVAPLIFLVEKLTEGKSKKEKGKIIVLIGAKTKSHILCEEEFKKLGCEVKVATDDGSKGFKGRVTDLLERELSSPKILASPPRFVAETIYACGPQPMLTAVARVSGLWSIPAQVSLEAHMCCGFGVCLGCSVDTINGYKRVCKDGPVFSADEIVWKK